MAFSEGSNPVFAVAALRGNLSAADAEQKSGQSKRAHKEASTAQRKLSDRNSSDGEEMEQDHSTT